MVNKTPIRKMRGAQIVFMKNIGTLSPSHVNVSSLIDVQDFKKTFP